LSDLATNRPRCYKTHQQLELLELYDDGMRFDMTKESSP
jgi:hypothetical protein